MLINIPRWISQTVIHCIFATGELKVHYAMENVFYIVDLWTLAESEKCNFENNSENNQ